MDLSPLQRERLRYEPTLPNCLAAGTHLFKFTVDDADIDKPWREEEKEEEEKKEEVDTQQRRRLERDAASAGGGGDAGTDQHAHYRGVVASDEPPLTPADAARATTSSSPPPRAGAAQVGTTTFAATATATAVGGGGFASRTHAAGVTPPPQHLVDLGDRGGRRIDVAEYFPNTFNTPVYHVVPGPALAGAGLAATERVRPIRMARKKEIRPFVFVVQ